MYSTTVIFLIACICFGDFKTFQTLSPIDEATMTLYFSEVPSDDERSFVTAEYTSSPAGEFNNTDTKTGVSTVNCVLINFAFETIVGGSIIILGLVGNSLSFIVLWRQVRSSASLLILASLSAADTLILTSIFFTKVLKSFAIYTQSIPAYLDFFPYVASYGWAVVSTGVQMTSYMTVLIAIHRYVAVCKPFKSASFSTIRRVRIQIVCVFLFAVLYNMPRFFERQVFTHYSENGTWIIEGYGNTELGNNYYYLWIYRTVMYYLLGFTLPLPILFFITIKLCKTLKKARESRKKMSVSKSPMPYDDITPAFIMIVLVYFIYQSAYVVRRIIHSIYPDDRKCGSIYYYSQIMSSFALIFNSSFNFIIYIGMCKSFRKTLKGLFVRSESSYSMSMSVSGTKTRTTSTREVDQDEKQGQQNEDM